jgi:hypothetical protein
VRAARGTIRMRPLVILAVLVAASSAAAQTVHQAPTPQAAPQSAAQPPLQQPLNLDPKIPWNLGGGAAGQASPYAPDAVGGRQPLSGPTLSPSIGTQPAPDSMPPDRRQEYVPALRLKVPL